VILTGFHAVEEYIKSRRGKGILYVSGTGNRIDRIKTLAGENGITVKTVSKKELSELAGGEDARGLLLSASDSGPAGWKTVDEFLSSDVKDDSLAVILDGITDPHNLGAVLRSAVQFGADIAVLPVRRSAKETSVVAKTSAGASSLIPVVYESNLVRAMEKLKKAGFWIYGARMDGERADKVDFSGKTALVLGSEGKGMRDLVEKNCDIFVSIPTTGKIDSLNVSVAAGILMYEIYRRKSAS